jgi:hypothetical protein
MIASNLIAGRAHIYWARALKIGNNFRFAAILGCASPSMKVRAAEPLAPHPSSGSTFARESDGLRCEPG